MGEKHNIRYISEQDPEFDEERHLLDIYYPDDPVAFTDVLVFIHGGVWISGSKDVYAEWGPVLRDKGLLAVIINYRLGNKVNYQRMAMDCAAAVKWVHEHIREFGGSPERIWLCGHSAGGHLASLITLNPEYFINLAIENPVKGCILLDAFGLNMAHFIREHGSAYLGQIKKVFMSDSQSWEDASPANFAAECRSPFLLLVGRDSYPFLIEDNRMFAEKLQKHCEQVHLEMISNRTHIEMITCLRNPHDSLYRKMLRFIKERTNIHT
jgi:acetyl esterase/lipase